MADTRFDAIRSARQHIPAVLPVRCADEIRLVPVSDIWFCTWTHNTAVVVTGAREFKVSKTLDALEARLRRYGFFRMTTVWRLFTYGTCPA